jgi:hypothetical protein
VIERRGTFFSKELRNVARRAGRFFGLIIASPYGKDSAKDSAQNLRFVRVAMIEAPWQSVPPSAVCKPILEFIGQEDFT